MQLCIELPCFPAWRSHRIHASGLEVQGKYSLATTLRHLSVPQCWCQTPSDSTQRSSGTCFLIWTRCIPICALWVRSVHRPNLLTRTSGIDFSSRCSHLPEQPNLDLSTSCLPGQRPLQASSQLTRQSLLGPDYQSPPVATVGLIC